MSITCPIPTPSSSAEFFGVNGVAALFAGTRGRTFLVSGVLTAVDIPTLNVVEATLLTYADGRAHVLVDPLGRTWLNVIFPGVYVPAAAGPSPLADGSGDPPGLT